MKNLDDIVKGLGNFINLWDTIGASNSIGQYWQKHEDHSYYWKDMKDALGKPMELESHFKNGFWPQFRVSIFVVDQYEDDGVLHEDFAQDAPYIGQRLHLPAESFCVARDVYARYFIVVRPADNDPKSFWLARALTNPSADSNHPNEIQIEYWHPTSKSKAFHQTYKG